MDKRPTIWNPRLGVIDDMAQSTCRQLCPLPSCALARSYLPVLLRVIFSRAVAHEYMNTLRVDMTA